MRKAVRAIVIHDNQLLVMHRNKFGQEYYTLIGGGIDPGESPEQALLREVHEESGLRISNPRLVYVEEAGDPFGTQYIYLCDYVSGEPALRPDSEEAMIHELGKNLYVPMWLPVSQFASLPFVSETLKQEIISALQGNFPAQPKTLHSES